MNEMDSELEYCVFVHVFHFRPHLAMNRTQKLSVPLRRPGYCG